MEVLNYVKAGKISIHDKKKKTIIADTEKLHPWDIRRNSPFWIKICNLCKLCRSEELHLLFPIPNCIEGYEFQSAYNHQKLHQKQLVPPTFDMD